MGAEVAEVLVGTTAGLVVVAFGLVTGFVEVVVVVVVFGGGVVVPVISLAVFPAVKFGKLTATPFCQSESPIKANIKMEIMNGIL